jgi:hypothetical protein
MSEEKVGLFASWESKTPWEWARDRRRWFITPLKDLSGASVVGIGGGFARYASGNATWLRATLEAFAGVAVAAFVLPQLETLFWRVRRKSILLDEAYERIQALKVEAGEKAAEHRRERQDGRPQANVPAPQESPRLIQVRRLLREASDYVNAMPGGRGKVDDALHAAWVVHNTVPVFLTRAFLAPPTQDYAAYLAAEKEKRERKFDMRTASAEFLGRLAGRIAEDNLDPGFLLPDTWLQFRETDPPESWPANVR